MVWACNAIGSRHVAAATAVSTGRREGFFIGVLSRRTPGTHTVAWFCMVAHRLTGGQWLIGASAQ
ncbi:hypothetical protein D9M68_948290 [compost metagenome]